MIKIIARNTFENLKSVLHREKPFALTFFTLSVTNIMIATDFIVMCV